MRHVLTAALAVLAFLPTPGALAGPPEKAKTPRERFQSLVDEQQKAMQDFSEAYQKAKTDEERNKVFQEKYPKPGSYAARFLKIAEDDPTDPTAVRALVLVVQSGDAGPVVARAVARLAKDHAADPKVAQVAPRLVESQAPAAETLLRAVLEKTPAREDKGRACLALGGYLKRQSELVRAIQENPRMAERIQGFFTQQGGTRDDFARLARRDPDALLKDAETAFERAEKEFGGVTDPRGTVGKTAKSELHEIRNLGVGKAAPEITGDDTDGKPFKLSDYKGKVVVVDFWGDW